VTQSTGGIGWVDWIFIPLMCIGGIHVSLTHTNKIMFMKKILLFAVIAVVGASFASCKKDYTCTCTIKETGSPDQTVSATIKNVTKSDAKKSCEGSVSTYNAMYGGASITCSL
jgi:hypothetical protein